MMHLESKRTRFDIIMAREEKKLKHMTIVVEAMEFALYVWCFITVANVIRMIWDTYMGTLQ